MFVTSDIYDLRRIAWNLDTEWREHLICGLVLHGPDWPGEAAMAGFIVAAARRCGLFEAMGQAGYCRRGKARGGVITPRSFEKIVRGELRGARGAQSLFLEGRREAEGARYGRIAFGGEASMDGGLDLHGSGAGPWPQRAKFLFPLDGDPFGVTADLFRLAVATLGVEYGYTFICDHLCGPSQYPRDSSVPPYFAPLGEVCRSPYDDWWRYSWDHLWREPHPLMRDLYQQNLLHTRHLSAPMEGLGSLGDWIAAEPGRGRLECVGSGRRLWSLSDAELVEVRPILNKAGRLYLCAERVYRDLPGGVAPVDRPIPPRIDFRLEDGTRPTYH